MTEQADLDVRTAQAAPAPAPSEGDSRLPLSLTQILGSVLAAVSATVVASYFGVAGTVIGAALGSLVSVVGGAVYTHSINRTRDKIKTRAVESAVAERFGVATGNPGIAAARGRLSGSGGAFGARLRRAVGVVGGRRLALSAAALFMFVLGAVTAFELVSGQPLSATVSASHGSGTSLGGGHRRTVQLPALPASPATSSSSSSVAPSAGGRSGATASPNLSTGRGSSSDSSSSGKPSETPSGSTGSAGGSTAAPATPSVGTSGTSAAQTAPSA